MLETGDAGFFANANFRTRLSDSRINIRLSGEQVYIAQ